MNSAIATITIDDYVINVSLTKGNHQFTNKDYTDYNEIKNLQFIIDFVKSIIDNKNLGFEANATYNDLSIELSGDISLNDLIKANISLDLSYKELSIPLNIIFTILLN